MSRGKGPVEPEMGSVLRCPGRGGQCSRVCQGLWRGACAAVYRQDAVCFTGLETPPRGARRSRRDFWLNMMTWPHPFITVPFLIIPPPMALKKLTELKNTRTMRTAEELTAGEGCRQSCGSQKVYGWMVTHLAER